MANIEDILATTGTIKEKIENGNANAMRGHEAADVMGTRVARIAELMVELQHAVKNGLLFDIIEVYGGVEGAANDYGEAAEDIAALHEGASSPALEAAYVRTTAARKAVGQEGVLAHKVPARAARQEMAALLTTMDTAVQAMGQLAFATAEGAEQAYAHGAEVSTIYNYETVVRGE